MPFVASALSRALTAARSSAVPAPSDSVASSSSTAGASASSRVLSPNSALPRCLMPSIAARSAAITCSPVGSGVSFRLPPARRNAVPQIGPDVPPIRLVSVIAVFLSRPAGSLYSMASQSLRTISNPRASEYPKSPSPTTASSSQKYVSLSTAVCATVRTISSACLSAVSVMRPPSSVGCGTHRGRRA